MLQHVGSDADVEANTKLKGLEEKLAAVGQNISSRVKVKELDNEDEEGSEQVSGSDQAYGQHRAVNGSDDARPPTAGKHYCDSELFIPSGLVSLYWMYTA